MDNILYLPVSLGEAIDKLTILDIKCEKIKDGRQNEAKKEYNMLHEKLEEFIVKYKELYQCMKKINLIIWDQMDTLRDGNINDISYTELCKKCIISNDIRFRIKNKINLVSNSILKEQKSYKLNRIIIELESDENILSLFIKPIQHFSYIYDEIIINSTKNIDMIRNKFYYDDTIKYNISTDDLLFKQKFTMHDKNYTKDQIYKIMNIVETELI